MKGAPGPDEEMKLLHTSPEDRHPWITIPAAPEEPSELRDHEHRFSQRGRRVRGIFSVLMIADEGLPLLIVEYDRTGEGRAAPPEHGGAHDPPGDDRIESEAPGETLIGLQLPLLYPAAALQYLMEDLYRESAAVVADIPQGIVG